MPGTHQDDKEVGTGRRVADVQVLEVWQTVEKGRQQLSRCRTANLRRRKSSGMRYIGAGYVSLAACQARSGLDTDACTATCTRRKPQAAAHPAEVLQRKGIPPFGLDKHTGDGGDVVKLQVQQVRARI